MASRLRNKTARISFLAFQDMISTVTGALMIVMVALSLNVNTRPPRTDQTAPDAARERLREAQSRLEATAESLRQGQGDLEALHHRGFVIPEPASSGREPVLVALSATNGCCSRLSQTNLVEFSALGISTEFGKLLQSWHPGRQRLVF